MGFSDKKITMKTNHTTRRVFVLFLCAALVWVLGSTLAFGATDIGNLTDYLRTRNTNPAASALAQLAIDDTVTFGFAPAGLKDASYKTGDRLVWRVVAIEPGVGTSLDSITLALESGSQYSKGKSEGLGLRPANRLETLPPFFVGYDNWADSEVVAWLNSSPVGPNGIDFSLATGGVEGFGFLETAFNPEIFGNVIVSFEKSTAEQLIVLPLVADFADWDLEVNDTSITRDFASTKYSLKSADGKDIKTGDTGFLYPVIKVNLTDIDDMEADWFASTNKRELLDAPTIFEQPLSKSFASGSRPASAYLAKVDAAIESYAGTAEKNYNKENLLYQWYKGTTSNRSKAVPVDAKTGQVLTAPSPSNDSATLAGSGITEVGRYVFFCDVIHVDGSETVRVSSVDVVISISDSQSVNELKCSQCHSSNVRKLHQDIDNGQDGFCSLCHKKTPKSWDADALQDGFKDGFTDYYVSCGFEDVACHGSGEKAAGYGGEWHGEDVLALHDVVNMVEVGDPDSGEAQLKDYVSLRDALDSKPLRVTNSCGGGVYGGGCHSLDSRDSRFYFGSMNLLTAHNDYATAQGSTLVETDALGTAGCLACHDQEGGKPLVGIAKTCDACHNKANGTYFEDSKLPCYKPVRVGGSETAARTVGTPNQQKVQEPAQASLGIQRLIGGLLGEPANVRPLEAGVLSLPSPELNRGFFPVGSLLDGTSPF
jgi:hypothetical protein